MVGDDVNPVDLRDLGYLFDDSLEHRDAPDREKGFGSIFCQGVESCCVAGTE